MIEKVIIVIILTTFQDVQSAAVKELYKWNYINFTWPNKLTYDYYYQTKQYIPENNIPSTIKIHGNRFYIALGRFYPGTPVTLGYITQKNNGNKMAPLITPYPSWEANVQNNCDTLQNVNAFDIDMHGVIWILDGLRHNNLTACNAKLVLYNITSNKFISSYEFPSEGDTNGAYMGDIVVDNVGNYAYITDSNSLDPGIIVYSKTKHQSWKLRDTSMFPDAKGLKFGNLNYYQPVGPITLSNSNKKTKFIFYSPVSSLNIYKINVNVIQNMDTIRDNSWRGYVHVAGVKVDQSYKYSITNKGELYFCLLNKNALAVWNVDKEFRTATYVAQNAMINWCTGATFGNNNVYLMSGNVGNYLTTGTKPTRQKNVFRLLSIPVNNKQKKT